MKIIFKKGFTLIELLVVVAIIGLLSSIVLASLNSARARSKDVSIKEEANQLATLMALNYNDYGSYCNLQPPTWVGTCNAIFSGTYAANAQNICTNMYNNAAENNFGSPGQYKILIWTYPATCATSYSFAVYLNDGNWLCSGSSGKGEYSTYYGNHGCYDNP